MSLKYEILKRIVKMVGLKNMWSGKRAEEIVAAKKKDIAIPASYMKTAVEIMRHGDPSVPDYMIWLQKADFTNCPHVTFVYGSDETLYACAPSFEKVMKKYGVDYDMIIGEGMFHCYPVFPIVKEAREGWKQMVELVASDRIRQWRQEEKSNV